MEQENISVSREILKASGWNVVSMIANYGALLLNLVILAHFVSPASNGRAAIAFGIAAFVMLFAQFGFANAIVAHKNVDKRFIDTLFTVSVLLAIVIYVAFFIASNFLGNLYNDNLMSILLKISGLGVLFSLFSAVPVAILQRSLNYKAQALVIIATSVFNLGATISLAIGGFEVWALIVPQLIGNFVGTIVAFYVSKYKPAIIFDYGSFKSSINFGVSGVVSNVSNFVCGNVVQILMGKVWSSSILGFYSFAEKQYSKPFDLISSQLVGSMFPIFSKISNDLQRIKTAYLKLTRLGVFVMLPVYLALIVGAPYIFPVVFGNQWDFSIKLFQIFCLVPIVRIFCIGATGILYSLRMPHLNAYVVLARVSSYIVAVVSFFIFKSDLLVVVKGVAAIDIVFNLVYLVAALVKLRCGIFEFISSELTPAILNLMFVIVLVLSVRLLGNVMEENIISFILALFVATGLYILLSRRYLYAEFKSVVEHINQHNT